MKLEKKRMYNAGYRQGRKETKLSWRVLEASVRQNGKKNDIDDCLIEEWLRGYENGDRKKLKDEINEINQRLNESANKANFKKL